jgi:hypothetical protein
VIRRARKAVKHRSSSISDCRRSGRAHGSRWRVDSELEDEDEEDEDGDEYEDEDDDDDDEDDDEEEDVGAARFVSGK